MSATTIQEPPAGDIGRNRWFLSSAPIVRSLIHLCVPMAAAMIVGAIYNLINAGVIGSLHITVLLAAVTLGSPILGLVMAVGNVFGVGGGAFTSRLMGAAERDATAAGLLMLDPIVSLLGASGEAFTATRAFVGVLLAFVPVLAAAVCLEQLVRAEGAARQVMIGLIASTIMNLLFDILFILVLHWGVAGAALATGLANLVLVLYFAFWLTRNSEYTSLAPRWFTLASSVVKPVLGVGVSTLLQSAFLIVTALVLNNLAAGYGEGPLAAMGVAVRIAQVPEFLLMGVTLGVLPLLAYSYGKGDRNRLSEALRKSAVAVGGIALVSSAVVFVFRDQVFESFISDPSVLTIGVVVLTAQLVAMIANAFTGLITSLFQATGLAMAATIMSVTQGILFIPVVLLGNLWFGLTGIIWALTTTEVAVLITGLVLWIASRGAIARGLAEGSLERAETAFEEQPA
ncbi:MATE family efflux transporter [Arthrobacter psychrolactophilus]|uniref:MATE family efflux transporter n=1 Tax=Arthrobacter psychrolactophilus TaxID=92442 RepID=A0A2V5ISB6_9MICC|nr:MATE family efflux transporter [Arthrobacter psychrolactophilus]PYI37104.1 MATE family efflux transporter [Arthrobacter psychrolactophilus]